MKKNTLFNSMLLSSLLFMILAAHAQAQDAIASLNFSTKKIMDIGSSTPDAAVKATPLNTFHSIFPEATEDRWYADDKGFTNVYFKTTGKTNRVCFNKKGKIIYSISYYQKEMLPVWVLQKVNDLYADKTIFGVTETTDHNGTTYVLVLEGKTSWVDVTITGNEIQDEQVWDKSKS